MDKLSLDTLAVRVVEWHNRHPLARRIEVRHVQSIGYVALPFRVLGGSGAAATAAEPPVLPLEDAAPGASLRERAMARSRQGAAAAESVPAPAPAAAAPSASPAAAGRLLAANFDEGFLAPIRMARVKRWALLHGREIAPPPADAPVRQVAASSADSGVRVYALTALIETAGKRSRMLVGAGDRPAILGRRLWSPQRLLTAAALVGLLAGAAWLLVGLRGATMAKVSAPAASAASAAAIASSSASSATAPMAAAPASAPLDVEPQLGRVTLPALNLPRGEGARNQAREQRIAIASAAVQTARTAAKPASAPAPAKPAVPEPTPPAVKSPEAAPPPERSPAMAAAATPGAPTFAVSTRILRTRAESEQVMVAMQALLATAGARGVRVEIVPNGADWRVVGWPFARRDDAERARALLASRGMRVQVVDF